MQVKAGCAADGPARQAYIELGPRRIVRRGERPPLPQHLDLCVELEPRRLSTADSVDHCSAAGAVADSAHPVGATRIILIERSVLQPIPLNKRRVLRRTPVCNETLESVIEERMQSDAALVRAKDGAKHSSERRVVKRARRRAQFRRIGRGAARWFGLRWSPPCAAREHRTRVG